MAKSAKELQDLLDAGNYEEFATEFLVSANNWRRNQVAPLGDPLLNLYAVAERRSPALPPSDDGTASEGDGAAEQVAQQEAARTAFFRILDGRQCWKYGPWRAIKQIWKRCEENGDVEAWAEIGVKAEEGWGSGKPSGPTRNYIRRRLWRHLRTLARVNPSFYVPYALGILERHTDSVIKNGVRRTKIWCFNHIGWHGTSEARGNSAMHYDVSSWKQRAAKRNWERDQWQLFGYTEYPYAELWNNTLPGILHTLAGIRNEEGAKFLIHVARERNAEGLETVGLDRIRPLFQGHIDAVFEFAFELLQKLPPERIPLAFMFELLESPHKRLQEFAVEWLKANVTLEQIGLDRLFELTNHESEIVAGWAMGLIREQVDPSQISWQQLTTLFNSGFPSVREEAVALANKHWMTWDPEPKAVVELADNIHPDIRKAVFSWIVDRYDANLHQRDDIFDLLDSDWTDVREFAKKFIEKYFELLDALPALARLAEHPEPGIQHWVVALVRRYLAEDADRLSQLLPFFRRVLFGVNRGADEKAEILRMLTKLAVASRPRAEAVLQLCASFVRSYGRIEQVRSLVGLAALRERFPDLDIPVELVPPPAAPARTNA